MTDDDTGFKILYEPSDNEVKIEYAVYLLNLCKVLIEKHSIVAVHGIGAHPDDTWCKEVSLEGTERIRTVNWLKDPEMLPSTMKDARIMRYGYQSGWFGRDALQQGAPAVAPRLLDSLKRMRKVCKLIASTDLMKLYSLRRIHRDSSIARLFSSPTPLVDWWF